jgi:GntR family transcriptional regulator
VNLNNEKELPNSKVLSLNQERSTTEQASRLQLRPKALVHNLLRIRFLDGRPVILERIILPARLFPDFTLPVGKEMSEELYVFYEQNFGVSIATAEERLTAVAADALAVEHLGVSENSPLLKIDRVALTLGGTPVEWRIGLYSTESHCYHVSLE